MQPDQEDQDNADQQMVRESVMVNLQSQPMTIISRESDLVDESSKTRKPESRAIYVALREQPHVSTAEGVIALQTFPEVSSTTQIDLPEVSTSEVQYISKQNGKEPKVVVQTLFTDADQDCLNVHADLTPLTATPTMATNFVLPTEPVPIAELTTDVGKEQEVLRLEVGADLSNHTYLQSADLEHSGFIMTDHYGSMQPDLQDAELLPGLRRERHHSNLEYSTNYLQHKMTDKRLAISRQRSASTSSSSLSPFSAPSTGSSESSAGGQQIITTEAPVTVMDDQIYAYVQETELPEPQPPRQLRSSVRSMSEGSESLSNCSKSKRKSKNPIPDKNKDERYWRRRLKNNMAARRSREAKRMKEDQIYKKSNILEERNEELLNELAMAKAENASLRERLSKYEPV